MFGVRCSPIYNYVFLVLLFFLLLTSTARADEFGDITVMPSAVHGNTYHGYAETRVLLENRSAGKTHNVTLIFPGHAFPSGNSISRLSRTLKIAPGARTVVSLLQPPLPAYGDGLIRVEVDGDEVGVVHAPNANSHISRSSYGGGGLQTVMLTSRGVDFEAVGRLLNAQRGTGFTAAMAVGGADSRGRMGHVPSAWMPDTTRRGGTNWLELDYAPPLIIDAVQIYQTRSLPRGGNIVLTGISGTEFAPISMSLSSSGGAAMTRVSFPLTSEPVKKVRLDFGTASPSDIGIDAVEIVGPSGNGWATDARASSDNSASASAMRSSPGAETIENLRAESPISEWSENWLAYTPYDAVVLSAADLNSMPPAVASAVWSYVQAGGNVFVFGKRDLPEAWRSTQKKSFAGGVEYNIGFGRCFALPVDAVSSVTPDAAKILHDAAKSSALYWQSLPRESSAANAALPVVENLKIPVRGIVFIMLAFVIAIGPVNLIVLSRKKRRTWMLWTIPAISFATCLLVFGYSFLREGITPDTRIAGLTFLDQINHRAATIGATAFYCPLTPSGGLRFNYETEATPLVQTDFSYGRYGRYGGGQSGTQHEVDWTQTQHFQRGWVSARVPAYFHIRKSETRRERIEVVKENGKLQIVNGLGAPIKSIWITDADSNVFEATEVAAGQKGGLIPAKVFLPSVNDDTGVNGVLRLVSFAVKTDMPLLKANAPIYLLPSSYIAVLDGNPFVENALSSSRPKRTKSSAIVFGILDPSDTK